MLVDRIRLVRVFVIVSKLSKPRDSQIMAQPSSIHNGRNETLFTFNLYQKFLWSHEDICKRSMILACWSFDRIHQVLNQSNLRQIPLDITGFLILGIFSIYHNAIWSWDPSRNNLHHRQLHFRNTKPYSSSTVWFFLTFISIRGLVNPSFYFSPLNLPLGGPYMEKPLKLCLSGS